MTVRRRDVFGLGALGFGALALEACSSGFPGPVAAVDAESVEHLLGEIDRVVARLESMKSDPKTFGIHGDRAEIDAGRERCIALLATLCFMGTYRYVPKSVWQEPHVAAHLKRTLPRIEATLLEARQHLADMSEEEVSRIDRRLTDTPDLAMRIMERLDDYAKQIDVPLEHRTYLRVATAQLATRFRYEGAAEVTAKLSSKYERIVAARIARGGTEDVWVPSDGAGAEEPSAPRSEQRNFLAAPSPRLGGAGDSCRVTDDCEESLECNVGVCTEQKTSKRLMKDAKRLALIGAWALIPPACPVGILILLVDAFMVIVAGILSAGGD